MSRNVQNLEYLKSVTRKLLPQRITYILYTIQTNIASVYGQALASSDTIGMSLYPIVPY